jgi:hypothetical protein
LSEANGKCVKTMMKGTSIDAIGASMHVDIG